MIMMILPVLKVVQKEAGSLLQSEVEFPLCRNFFISENGEFRCIPSGILCDLELQESKQETRYRPGKSKGAGSPTRPHFKPWILHSLMTFMACRFQTQIGDDQYTAAGKLFDLIAKKLENTDDRTAFDQLVYSLVQTEQNDCAKKLDVDLAKKFHQEKDSQHANGGRPCFS